MGKVTRKSAVAAFCLISSFSVFAAPKWANNPGKDYPSSTYLCGVGEGPDKTFAEMKAIEQIAGFFGRDISSTTKASSRMVQATLDGKVATGSVKGMSNDITSKIDVADLIGIEVKESVQEGSTYYVLAVLDKPKTVKMLESSIMANLKTIKSLMNYPADDEFSFETYARLDLAKDIAQLNDAYMKKLDALDVDLAASLKPSLISAKQIQVKRGQIAKQIPIYVEVENDFENQVKQAFAKMVKASGFNTSENDGERYRISGTVSLVPRQAKDGKTVQILYDFEGYLEDTLLGEQIMPINKVSGREGAPDEQLAVVRTYAKIAKIINDKVAVEFKNYLESIRTE